MVSVFLFLQPRFCCSVVGPQRDGNNEFLMCGSCFGSTDTYSAVTPEPLLANIVSHCEIKQVTVMVGRSLSLHSVISLFLT